MYKTPITYLETNNELEMPIVFKHYSDKNNDRRGYFHTLYTIDDLKILNIPNNWTQDNRSFSKAGTLRGLHYQLPFTQEKLVEVPYGKILAFALDIRNYSKTFGGSFYSELSEDNDKIMYIPHGFAFGFYAIDDSIVRYKVSELYCKTHEHELHYSALNKDILKIIGNNKLIMSNRDTNAEVFDNTKTYFE